MRFVTCSFSKLGQERGSDNGVRQREANEFIETLTDMEIQPKEKLDCNSLLSIWKVTYPDWPIDEYIDGIKELCTNSEGLLSDIRDLLFDEISRRNRIRQRETEQFIESLMNIEPQPLIIPPKHPRRPILNSEELAEAIKDQYGRRQQRINELA